MNNVTDLARRFSLQIRKLRADAKKVTIGGGHFYSRQNEEIIDRQTIQPHQSFFEEIINSVARNVIGDGYTVQGFGTCSGDQVLRAGNSVSGKKGVCVKVDVKRHRHEASLERPEWKALV